MLYLKDIRKCIIPILVLSILLSSMGFCFSANYDCQQGKWMACTLIFFATLIALFKNPFHHTRINYSLLPIIACSQVADLFSQCWTISSLTWILAIFCFVILCQRITNIEWFYTIAISLLVVLSMDFFRSCGVNESWGLQIFDNSAGEASSLVMGLSCMMITMPSLRKISSVRIHMIEITMISCMALPSIALLFSHSRTGFVASLLSIAIFFAFQLKSKISPKIWFAFGVGICLSAICIATLLYFRNPNSVRGRFLTYQVVLQMIAEHPWLGWGSNALDAHYMASQARFLHFLSDSHIYRWLAGDVVRPFNEILNGLMCYGFTCMLVAICMILLIWKNLAQSQRCKILPVLIAWTALGMTSYPSYYPYACLLLAGSFGNLFKEEGRMVHPQGTIISKNEKTFSLFILVGGIYMAILQVYKAQVKEEWLERFATEDCVSSFDSQAEIPSIISKDIDVRYTYAVNLNLSGEYSKSQDVLNSLKGELQSYDTEILAGDNTLSMHQWNAANQHFQLAHEMVPVRFMPLFGQMQVCLSRGDSIGAHQIAKAILLKKVKIDSEDIHFIKSEARKALGTN